MSRCSAPVTGAAADEYNLNVVDCNASVTVARRSSISVSGGLGVPPVLYFVLCSVEGAVTLSSTGAKNRFKEMTPATSDVMARFPTLLPIRNPGELRGLCRRSYFGPWTCGGSITIVIEVGRALNPLNPGFPFSPLNVHFCVQSQAQRC